MSSVSAALLSRTSLILRAARMVRAALKSAQLGNTPRAQRLALAARNLAGLPAVGR